MEYSNRPTIGLALSGSGDRTSFYIGFLEKWDEEKLPIDYIAACSGGSLVAAAYACGNLKKFKKMVLNLDENNLKKFFKKGKKKGGLYSLDNVEDLLREYTDNYKFEDVRPLMAFVAVDIETSKQVVLSMGDIAKAAMISCTLPGIFEPVKWGGKTLIDGGLLNFIPVDVLKQVNMDIKIGINLRGTKFIFTKNQMTVKKIVNVLKKIFLFDEIEAVINYFIKNEDSNKNWQENPGIFSVLGKSMDIAIGASKTDVQTDFSCDLMIKPDIKSSQKEANKKFKAYYELGKKTAEEYIPEIKQLIKEKSKNEY